jgi:hypothetical protein
MNEDANGNRELDCSANSKTDRENICECDKRFAENIAKARSDCDAGAPADDDFGEHCMDEQYRTASGSGSFVPQLSCDKKFHGHDKDKCCGIYPDRYPYDTNFKECCQTKAVDHQGDQLDVFSLLQAGECTDGTVVVSEPGNPHSYVAVGGA